MVVDAVWLESSRKLTASQKQEMCEQSTRLQLEMFDNSSVTAMQCECWKGVFNSLFLEITGPVGDQRFLQVRCMYSTVLGLIGGSLAASGLCALQTC